MKKLFSMAMLGAIAYAIYRTVTGQQRTETLWREATRDLDLR
jgi:hypothetical protein